MNKQWEFQKTSQMEAPHHPNQKHRSEAILWAISRLSEGTFVILDTETTGTNESDQIVQLGIISSTGECIYSGLVKPIGTDCFDPEVVRIHGITYDMVKNAPTMGELVAEVKNKIGAHAVLAYNAAFDKRLLHQSCSIAKVPAPAWNWDCVMLQYAKFVGEPGRKAGDYRWQKLPRDNVKQKHDATGDCLLTLRLLEKMASAKGYAG